MRWWVVYFSAVDFAPALPILYSSPTMRDDPQRGFAFDILRISCRIFFDGDGRLVACAGVDSTH